MTKELALNLMLAYFVGGALLLIGIGITAILTR